MLDEVGLGFNEPSPGVGGLGGSWDFGSGTTTSDVARRLLSDLNMGDKPPGFRLVWEVREETADVMVCTYVSATVVYLKTMSYILEVSESVIRLQLQCEPAPAACANFVGICAGTGAVRRDAKRISCRVREAMVESAAEGNENFRRRF
jgi:hypothetical protein